MHRLSSRAVGAVATGVGGAAVGALTWTATEYVMHRWVLHGPFGHGRLRRIPLGGIHRTHHREPLKTSLPGRLAGHSAIAGVAVAASAALSTITPVVFARCAGAAWSAGYSTYEVVHWSAHHRPARSAWGERVRERHMAHHYGAPKANMGVTMSWWDSLLGTEAPATTSAPN